MPESSKLLIYNGKRLEYITALRSENPALHRVLDDVLIQPRRRAERVELTENLLFWPAYARELLVTGNFSGNTSEIADPVLWNGKSINAILKESVSIDALLLAADMRAEGRTPGIVINPEGIDETSTFVHIIPGSAVAVSMPKSGEWGLVHEPTRLAVETPCDLLRQTSEDKKRRVFYKELGVRGLARFYGFGVDRSRDIIADYGHNTIIGIANAVAQS